MTQLNRDVARLKERGYDWPIPWEAVELIARAEACRLVAYLCPAGVWTIGWGETNGGGVKRGDRWTAEQADSRFLHELWRYVDRVCAMVREDVSPHELGAMTSLAYNIGLGSPQDTKNRRGFFWSKVRTLHLAGDDVGASRAYRFFNKARVNGVLTELPGLTARRAAEAALHLRPDPDVEPEPMPQAVETESKLAASPIAQGGAVSAAGGLAVAAPALAPVLEHVEVAKGAMATLKALADQAQEFLGFPPVVLLGLALVVAGWLVVRWRAKQRAQGWA